MPSDGKSSPCLWQGEKNMNNPLKTHQNTLVSHPTPQLPSASIFFDVTDCSFCTDALTNMVGTGNSCF
jgi:hypothetical protein